MSILKLIILICCIVSCYKMAAKKNRNEILAAVMGLLFNVFAVIVYYLLPNKDN